MQLVDAVVNLRDTLSGGVADLRQMPRDAVATHPAGPVLYRYRPVPRAALTGGAPVLLVPPLGAPDFAYDLRRGCSLVEHLLDGGRTVYLVDHGRESLADRGKGLEHWVDDVVPWAVRGVGRPVHLAGWSLGGLFVLLAIAAAREGGSPLPVLTATAIASPVDLAAVPLVAPLRPLAAVTGGRGLSLVYRALGVIPGPLVSAVFQLTTVDRLLTRPLTIASRLDDRDCLAQIEAVDHLMAHMHAFPGRAFGQLYHLLLRANDLADGTITLAGREIALTAVDTPVLVVAGQHDVIAPRAAVLAVRDLLTGAPEVVATTAPGGHLGVLTGRRARHTTWLTLDAFLADHP